MILVCFLLHVIGVFDIMTFLGDGSIRAVAATSKNRIKPFNGSRTAMKEIAITENHLFTKVYKSKKKVVGKYVVVYILNDLKAKKLKRENPEKKFVNRIGFTVSKKLGGAVQRNRAKRVMRAAFRAAKAEGKLRGGNLIVISPRFAILGAKSTDVSPEIRAAFSSLGLYEATRAE